MIITKQVVLLLSLSATVCEAWVLPSKPLTSVVQRQKQSVFTALHAVAGDEVGDAVNVVDTPAEETAVESASEETTVESASEETAVESASEETTVESTSEETTVASASEETAVESASEEGAEAVPAKPMTTGFFNKDEERFTIFIGNLPFDVTVEEIKEVYAEFGGVKFVSLPRHRQTGRGRGFAFVDMSSKEEMDLAITGTNGRDIAGRQIRVENSDDRQTAKPKIKHVDEGFGKVYIGSLPFDVTEADIKELFVQFGEVRDIYLPKRDDGVLKGFGFVTIESDAIETAIDTLNGDESLGRRVTVSHPRPPQKNRGQRVKSVKMFCGNLSWDTNPETLEDVFSEFGEVLDCYVPTDRDTGNRKGFAFVTMSKEDAQSALDNLDGMELDDRIIRVSEATARPSGKQNNQNRWDDNNGNNGGDESGSDVLRW